MTAPGEPDLDRILQQRLVRPVFQPVVDLDREVVVAYEALARGSDGATPATLFQAAHDAGRVAELDWLCREQAVQGARAAGVRHPLSLLINAEPETLLASGEDAGRWASFGDLRCYAELTERDLVARPAQLLRALDQVREQDWGIALDDVGSHPASLALLPLLRPDLIKLDLRLLQQPPAHTRDLEVARVLHAALTQAAQTGAVIVAEGIETPEHLELARAYGAHYGQGYLLGRPAPLPEPLATPPVAVPLLARPVDRSVTPAPFAVVASVVPTRRLSRDAVLETARQLLAQAAVLDPAPVVLVCVDDPDLLPAPLLEVLGSLGRLPLLGVVGRLPAGTAVQVSRLQPGDPAHDDVDVVVVSAHFSGGLFCRRALPQTTPQSFDGVLTFDRPLVCSAATSLLHRLGEPAVTAPAATAEQVETFTEPARQALP